MRDPGDEQALYVALINDGEIWRIGHEDGRAECLATGCERPMSIQCRGGWLTWLDCPFITHPKLGAPYSISIAVLCGMSCHGGAVGRYGRLEDGGWDPAVIGDRVAWVTGAGEDSRIVCVRAPGGTIETLIGDLEDVDPDGGFVHLASTGDALVVAKPTRSWLRTGVELRRYRVVGDGAALAGERIDFVAGDFNGLDASEHGIGLVVERSGDIRARYWGPDGREGSLSVPRQPGPLVKPTVGPDGLYFAVGAELYRLCLD